MILDCAGLDSSSDSEVSLESSAGPGDGVLSVSPSAAASYGSSGVDDMGNDDSLRLAPPSPVRTPVGALLELPGLGDDDPPTSLGTAVPADVFLDTPGLAEAFIGVPDPLPVFGAVGESRRSDLSPAADSEPGMGDGALEPPLAAAVALFNWARICEACRSVR